MAQEDDVGAAAAEAPAGGAELSGNTVSLKDRYDIATDEPLPELDTPPAVAHRAVMRRDTRRPLFALICDPKLPPRLSAVSAMHRINHRNVMPVVDWGVVYWPAEGRRCPILILERPGGKSAFASLEEGGPGMYEEEAIERFVRPMIAALRELHGAGIVHRAIRPDNIYLPDSADGEIVLGECVSAPAGIAQPLAYETIQGGQAAPAGRGEGSMEHDLYALGVTLLALLTGKSPGLGREDAEILRDKLVVGSYAALVQKQRVSLTMMEPLRGLLNDDPKERWTLEELLLWASGRRLSPKQQALPTKAARSFSFAGATHATARELAQAFAEHWDEAIIPVTDGTVDQWLRRSLSEDDRVEAMNIAKDGGADTDRMMARALIALDPPGPIRVRDFRANLDGVQTLIAAHANDATARQLFTKVLTYGLINFWLEFQPKATPDQLRVMSRYDRVRAVLDRTQHGFGFERILYELNVEWPCLSPLFERDYVPLLDFILPALDRMAAQAEEPPRLLVDRHVAAFILVHVKRGFNADMTGLDSDDPRERRLGEVRVLSALQSSVSDQPFPALCAAAAKLLEPSIDRFHGASRRKRLAAQLKKAAKTGKLASLLDVVDNGSEVSQDNRQFNEAVAYYAETTNSLNQLTLDKRNLKRLSADVGGQVASTLSIMLAGLSGTVLLIWAIL